MVSLLMRMNERLAETEKALEESLQGKQGELASQPSQTAPIVTTAPSSGHMPARNGHVTERAVLTALVSGQQEHEHYRCRHNDLVDNSDHRLLYATKRKS